MLKVWVGFGSWGIEERKISAQDVKDLLAFEGGGFFGNLMGGGAEIPEPVAFGRTVVGMMGGEEVLPLDTVLEGRKETVPAFGVKREDAAGEGGGIGGEEDGVVLKVGHAPHLFTTSQRRPESFGVVLKVAEQGLEPYRAGCFLHLVKCGDKGIADGLEGGGFAGIVGKTL